LLKENPKSSGMQDQIAPPLSHPCNLGFSFML